MLIRPGVFSMKLDTWNNKIKNILKLMSILIGYSIIFRRILHDFHQIYENTENTLIPCIFYRKPYSKYHENTWNFMDLEIVFFGCKSKFPAPLFFGMAVLGWFQPSIPMQLNFQFRGLSIDFLDFTPYCALHVREQVLRLGQGFLA